MTEPSDRYFLRLFPLEAVVLFPGAELPLMVFERLYGVAIYKEVLQRRGIIGSTARRAPGPDIDADDRRELEPALQQVEDLFRV